MKTLNWKNNINESELKKVSECLESGGLVIFPTETVYGLGAIATNKKSVDSIFIAKGRANDNPLIVHLDSKEEIEKYAIIENDIETNFCLYARTIHYHFKEKRHHSYECIS